MRQVLAVLLLGFGGFMLTGLLITSLINGEADGSMTWLEWKQATWLTLLPTAGLGLSFGGLLCVPGSRLRSLGITLLVAAGVSALVAYSIIAMFAMNEEVVRLDPKLKLQTRDYVVCASLVASYAVIGVLLLRAGHREAADFES